MMMWGVGVCEIWVRTLARYAFVFCVLGTLGLLFARYSARLRYANPVRRYLATLLRQTHTAGL